MNDNRITKFVFIIFSLVCFSAQQPKASENKQFVDFVDCEKVNTDVENLLLALQKMEKAFHKGGLTREELNKQHIAKVLEFMKGPHLSRKLLCLQKVIGEGDGEFYGSAFVTFYTICKKVDPVRLLPQLAAYLEAPDISNQQRQHIHEILRLISAPGDDDGQRFDSWEPFLRERKSDPPLKLVDWMFEDWKTDAFKIFSNIYIEDDEESRKEVLQTAKAVEEWHKEHSTYNDGSPKSVKLLELEAKRALVEIGNRDEWWGLLYLAQVFEAYPDLRSPAVIERLEKSDHPLVKEEVKKIEESGGD